MNGMTGGRLSTLQAAFVVARRDFTAILFSRSFIFFLIGPLFPLLVAGMAGGIGKSVEMRTVRPVLGVAMSPADTAALQTAREELGRYAGNALPRLVVIDPPADGQDFDAAAALKGPNANLAAIATGTLEAPVLTGPPQRVAEWKGPLALLAARGADMAERRYPEVQTRATQTSKADQGMTRVLTAQGGQLMLFLLTMMLAGMVLSNLVEEKGNKIIEILAAAIPMDAVFLGKLFAMLAISFVAIACWSVVGGGIVLANPARFGGMAAPAVGWPVFLLLGVAYFAMAYLLIGSVFLAIGSMATTVRDVQALSMPATMLQLVVFFLASFAIGRPGTTIELGVIIFPFSSPFAMLARAAQDPALWPHTAALAWQALCVLLLVRAGASLFKRRVMKSGPAQGRKRR